jgi:carboxylate-amine ligase
MASSSTISLEANSGDSRAAFRFGIEEEYFLSDAATLRPAVTTPDSLFKRLGFSGARLERELLQSQMEVATRPHLTSNAARDELKELREAAARTCKRHGLKILACGTHPMGAWRDSVHSPKPRYEQLMEDLQILARRNMLCGMHVHVEIPEAGRRIDIMSRMLPYLPLLLALSTSSPFWEGSPTGLKGYRLTAYDELPRTGLPELFTCEKDYAEYLEAMRQSGAIADASQVWWSIRPSPKYPTLELRAPDCCTRLDDAVAVASLYRVMVRHLHRCPDVNEDISVVERALAVENKWRAQRYGSHASFVTRDGPVSISELLERVIARVEPDADALNCLPELDHCRSILSEGTSADAQLHIFEHHQANGRSDPLSAVATWIADATVA